MEGYMDNGVMKYRKYPWWKRVYFRMCANENSEKKSTPTTVTEYLEVVNMKLVNYLFRTERDIAVAVYRDFEKETNKTLRLYGRYNNHTIDFNVDVYTKDNLYLKL
jgi:hypothetical protein